MIKALYKSLGEQVFAILKTRIEDSELSPGTVLQIDRLAEEFSVSTTPVREALLKLEAIGLVAMSPNRRATVSAISEEQTREILEFRRILESAGARYAARSMTNDETERLIAMVSAANSQPFSKARYVETDIELHNRALFQHISNSFIRKALDDLQVHLRRIRFYAEDFMNPQDVAAQVCSEHLALLRALQLHNEDAAECAMYTHLSHSIDRTLSAMKCAHCR